MTTKRLLLLALLIHLTISALAQNEAPNYFHANSNIFKYRLAEIRNDYSTFYKYEYDKDNYLLKETCTDENGSFISDTRYYYNQAGYMTRSEKRDVFVNGLPICSQLNEYTRDENGYIMLYSRHTLHGELPYDTTLTEDVRIDLQYNDEFLPTHADISFYIDASGSWQKGRETTINYYDNNLIHEIIQYVDNEELSREVLTYNDNDKISLYSYTSGTGNYEYTYLYDNNLNIYKAGYDGFWFEYQYNTSYLSAETFLPSRTVDELVYFGFQTCTFRGLPYGNSENAVIKEELSGAEMVYEDVSPVGLSHILSEDNHFDLIISDNILNVNVSNNLLGKTVKIYNILGVCFSAFVVEDELTSIDISSYPRGCYIITAENVNQKFIKH